MREQHAHWDGLTFKISDKFWLSHYPPNDWGCRCDVEQEDDAKKLTKNYDFSDTEIPMFFRNNVGESNVLFNPDAHPYFTGLSANQAKAVEAIVDKVVHGDLDNYTLHETNEKTGAKLFIHKNADPNDLDYNIEQSKVFLKNGISVKIREHSYVRKDKNPELEIAGKIGDFKTPEENTHSSLQTQIKSAGSQKAHFAAIILDGRNYTEKDFIRALRGGFQKGFNTSVEFVYLIKGKDIIKITRSEVEDYSFIVKIRNIKGNP